jgi:diacylglycerol kinase (ATP)
VSRPSEPRTVFLVNPASDNGRTGRRWPELSHAARAHGLAGDALFSERPGQLAGLARQAIEDGATLLVAVGGDGTVQEIANGIAGVDGVELAVIPRGTGFDFARTFGIPPDNGAFQIARDGHTIDVDLGRVSYRRWDGGDEDAYFANIASAGMSGAIARRANETTKAMGAKASYLWSIVAVFARWHSDEVRVTVDGEERAGLMHDVIVANGRYLAGGIKICPEARPDDGLFDVLLIGNLAKRDLMVTLPKAYFGKHLPHPKAELLRGREVTVDAAEPLPIQLDGEQPGTTPARFEIVPKALRLRVQKQP